MTHSIRLEVDWKHGLIAFIASIQVRCLSERRI